MSQTSITSFFKSVQPAATDDIFVSKSKIARVKRNSGTGKAVRKAIVKKSNIVKYVRNSVQNDVKLNGLKNTMSPLDCMVEASPSRNSPEHKELAVFVKKQSTANISKSTEPKVENVNSDRKELSMEDIRKKLAGSSRLPELRATADRLGKVIQDLMEASGKENLREFKFIEMAVPSSPGKKGLIQKEITTPSKEICPQQHSLISPRKVFASPIKSPSKVPAYIRLASLATPTTSLSLPHQYHFLAECFCGMEIVVALLYNRNEKITFNKLKPSVQEMLKQNLSEKHLGQIKQLVPYFYNFEKVEEVFSTSTQKGNDELVISPNIPNDIKTMNPRVLLERQRYFYDTLLQLAKKHHAQFLATLDPPMVIADDKLIRWHPEFEIEKLNLLNCP